MKTITLAKEWSHVTPERTVTFPAGEHEVTNEIAAAAEADGVWKDESNGAADRTAKAGKALAADRGEG
jgi:hypothetical protein